MGSIGAMNKVQQIDIINLKQKDKSKYVPEGVEGFVKYKGRVDKIFYQLIGGLKVFNGIPWSKKIKILRQKSKIC